MRFTDKVAIVTGAAGGIGRATAKRLGSEGARVVIADLNKEKADAAAVEVMDAGAPDAVAIVCDVANETAVESTVTHAFEKFGRIDVVVNNAGLMVFKPIVEQTGEDFLKILNVDLLGAFYFTKQAFLRMKPGSAIVNVSSVHAVETEPLVSSYAAAKAALLSLTRSSTLEGKALGIRVNAILPGAVDT
ncbi:MAG TPA: SDR family NAD(P)-dependent oxidoreductase, partial [Pyrinomonadaceae bacterium]|nr:SDR family NAD(P)-dependent oxidoreductase [Pyrinomonadaceae bacterium]